MNTLNMTIQRWLILGFAFGPIALAIIGWLAYSNTADLSARRDLSQHTYEVLGKINNIRTSMIDAETGMRGLPSPETTPSSNPIQEGAMRFHRRSTMSPD